MQARHRPDPPDSRALPAHPSPAGGRSGLSARHPPWARIPAPGVARGGAFAHPSLERRAHELAFGAAARFSPAARIAARRKMSFVRPDWPAPAGVHALVTTRSVGDMARGSAARSNLRAEIPGEPVWLRQVHGIAVLDADAQRAPGIEPV